MSGSAVPSVTDSWLSAAPMLPQLTSDAARTAERLLLLLHYGVDWSAENWVGSRRGDYWDSLLPSRVRLSTYSSADLHEWWTRTAAVLGSSPTSGEQRAELAALLVKDPRPVLEVLRESTTALVLRTRIVADAVRTRKGDSRGVGGGGL